MYYPIQCYIELTQECNLKCAHCFAEGSPNRSSELSLDQVKHIYEQINDLGIIYVNISGGEPLLDKDFFKIIEYVAEKPFSTCVLTNGTTWEESDIEKFALADPNRNITIQISIDGPFEIMNKHRGISIKQYNKIFQTAAAFRTHGFAVTCLQVVDSITAPYIIETAKDVLYRKGFDNVKIVPLFITGRAVQNIDTLEGFWSEWTRIVKEVTLIKKNKLWGEFSNKLNMGFFTLYELVAPLEESNMLDDIKEVWGLDICDISNYRKQLRRKFYCEGGCSELTISSNMELYPCVASIRTNLNCGNLKNSNLVDLWNNSEILNSFRNDIEKTIFAEPCKSCKYKEFCGGGCRLVSLSLHGEFNHVDTRCPYVIKYLNEHKD